MEWHDMGILMVESWIETGQIQGCSSSKQVKAIIFDKTGTLTHGKPDVTKVLLFVAESVCPHTLFLAIVGLAESNSEHPLGMAVTNYARSVSFLFIEGC